jgi:hypothetical protein
MNGTYIKLYRKMTEWEWYDDTNCVRVFLHLMLKANWNDSTYKGYDIPRGSIVTGRKALSEQLGLSEQTIRTTIKKLVNSQSINQQVTSKFSILSVCHYDTYNPDKSVDQPAANQQTNQQTNRKSTTDQPASNHQDSSLSDCQYDTYSTDKNSANRKVTTDQPATNQQTNRKVTTSKEDKKLRRKEDNKTTYVPAKEAHQLRAEKLFNRPEDRTLDKSELSAWKSAEEIVKSTTEREWQQIEAFYAAPQKETYARKSYATLLNNFSGELDRAADWHRKNHQPQPKLGTPPQWT